MRDAFNFAMKLTFLLTSLQEGLNAVTQSTGQMGPPTVFFMTHLIWCRMSTKTMDLEISSILSLSSLVVILGTTKVPAAPHNNDWLKLRLGDKRKMYYLYNNEDLIAL